jgi:small subunit ribosomal protein S13
MFLYKQLNLKLNTDIRNSLKVVYGIGKFKSYIICTKLGFGYPYSINNLNLYNFGLLIAILDCYSWLEVRIKRFISQNIQQLININCYRGFRHKDKLPCYGQRTRTNAKSCRRNKIFYG